MKFIYALKDPMTGAIRYVGMTKNLVKRLRCHLCTRENNHRGCWIRSLLSGGFNPVMEILDEVPDCEWPMWEVAYIQFFRDEGCDLVNGTVGGDGVDSTPESLEKRRLATLGENHHFFGKHLSPEHRRKLSEASRGKPKSPEHRVKVGLANRGKVRSPELKAHLSRLKTGKTNSIESRVKASISMKLHWANLRAGIC